jgi:predicted dehydrogenase
MRVGIVGAGLIGKRRSSIIRNLPDQQVIVIADIDRERAEAAALENECEPSLDWREVVARPDVDIVIVSTVNKFLMPISVAALERGKHVLCEKPPGRNAQETEQMVQAARENNVRLKVGFNHRYHRAVRQAHRLYQSGAIGKLCFMRGRYGHGGRAGYEKEWRANPEQSGGGELLDQGIHLIDLFRLFAGEFVEAFGWASTYHWKIAPVEDNAFGLFRTAAGQVASLHASWTQWKNLFSLEVFGRDGYLMIEGLGGSYGKETLTWGQRRAESGPPSEQTWAYEGEDPSWADEWSDFVSAIESGREPEANGSDGLEAMRLVQALYESSRSGTLVKMPSETISV